jgi:uncharacterized protein YjdB
MAFALAVTSVGGPSVTAEAATNKKAVKSVTLKVNNKKVNKKTTKLQVGKTLTVKTTVNPSSAKKSISYKTSNKKIATVSKKGKVKGIKAGTAKITVTVTGKNKKKKSAWFKVKVEKKKSTAKATATPKPTTAPQEVAVTKVTLSASATTIAAGQTAQVYADIQPTNATNKSLTYTSSDETVATITNTGIVTALKDGETTITATAANGVKGTLEISVKTVQPTSMSLNVSTLDLAVGGTSVLSTVFVPANTTERNVTWSSSEESVAKVDNNGTVTATGEGKATITATSENGLTATCTVNVKAKTNDNTNGVTISVANSLKAYENTVFTGNNADVKVRVYKDGKPVGNTDVTLKMQHKSADNYWYISNNQSTTSTVKTDSQGIASFTISLMPGCDFNATDGVMGGYLLTATATGASTTAQAPLTFARFTVGSKYGHESVDIESDEYCFSNITVNNVLTDLVQGENAAAADEPVTKTIERRMINENSENELIGTSEYVVSQQSSTAGTTDHAVTFNAAPLIEYPEVITGTDDDNYMKYVNYTSGEYDVYDTTQSTYIQEVPTNLNWAKLQFGSVSVSQHAALKIDVFANYDENGKPIGDAIASYAIIGEHLESDFGFQIPIQKLASEAGVEDFLLIKVYIQTEGQVDLDKAKLGFTLDYIGGNYVGTSKYKEISEPYEEASIEWKKVNAPGTDDDSILTASYQSKVKMTEAEALAYGIDTTNKNSNYYKATVEYKIPNYPHIGDAYVTVTKQNKEVEYFMIPTYTDNNENKLMTSVKAYRASDEEALNYVGTMTSDDYTVTVNSEKSGVTEVYGYLTVPELNYLTKEERRLFAYVNWAPNPEEKERPVTDFYALVGQTITIDALVTDNNGNKKSDEEVSFYLNRDLDDEVKLTKDTLVSGVTITNDSSKFDDTKYTVKTDATGVAHITFRSDSYANGIFVKDLSAKCPGYNVTISVDGVEATYAKLYWIAPGLSFTDQTEVKAEEAKDQAGAATQVETTTVSYQQASKEAVQTAEESQEKFVGTKWKIGYNFVGYVTGSAVASTLEEAETQNFSNVVISGLGADVNLWKYGTKKTAPNGTEIDAENKKKEDASIKITSEKVGTDLVEAILDSTTISKDANITFTLLNDAGQVIKTVKNSGKGDTTAHVGLNVPIKWKPADMLYEIIAPSGKNFAVVGEEREDVVYVKVFDSRDNMLDGYEVKWTVKKTDADGNAEDITAEIVEYMGKDAAVDTSKNGLVAIRYKAPKEKCLYEFTATVEGNDTKPMSINYEEKVPSTNDLGMQTAEVDEDTQSIIVTLSDKVNPETVLADMFTVMDDTGKPYTVTVDSVNNNVITLKLANAINSSAKYLNVTYNEIVEDLDMGTTACRMVSSGTSPVIMENGFTVTAYASALPTIKYNAGAVTATKNTLYDGAYVIFTYGTTVKSVLVTGSTAVDADAVAAEEVVAYTGNVSTAINAEAEAEVVEEGVEATEVVVE